MQQKVDACCSILQDTGKDPISGADASLDDLVAVKGNHVSVGSALLHILCCRPSKVHIIRQEQLLRSCSHCRM